jgi:hypothetical protein
MFKTDNDETQSYILYTYITFCIILSHNLLFSFVKHGRSKLYEDRHLKIISECKSVTPLFLFKQGGTNEHLIKYFSLKNYNRITVSHV